VWKLDRFARNRYDSATHKAKLKKHGVKVVSATEPISQDSTGILLESLIEGYNEYFSAELAEKVKRGHAENALKRKWNGGGKPVGYYVDDGKRFAKNVDCLLAKDLLQMNALMRKSTLFATTYSQSTLTRKLFVLQERLTSLQGMGNLM